MDNLQRKTITVEDRKHFVLNDEVMLDKLRHSGLRLDKFIKAYKCIIDEAIRDEEFV